MSSSKGHGGASLSGWTQTLPLLGPLPPHRPLCLSHSLLQAESVQWSLGRGVGEVTPSPGTRAWLIQRYLCLLFLY